MEQFSLLLAYSVFDILLKRLKSLTQTVENSDYYTKTLSELLLQNLNFEVYQHLKTDSHLKIARTLANKLFIRMDSYTTTQMYDLMLFEAEGPQYNFIRLPDGPEIYSISFPAGLFGNKAALLKELTNEFAAINLFLNFPPQWQTLKSETVTFFSRLPSDISHMTGSYYMDQDLASLPPFLK